MKTRLFKAILIFIASILTLSACILTRRHTDGDKTVYRINGNYIEDISGNILYRVNGFSIEDHSGTEVFRMNGNEVEDASGNLVYRIKNGYIEDASGKTVYKTDGRRISLY